VSRISNLEESVRDRVVEAFATQDVRVGGDRPWDIRVADERFFDRVVREGSLGLGESYVDGWWECRALDQLFERLGKGQRERTRSLGRYLLSLRSKLLNLQSRARAKEVVEHHYDLPVVLFERMLDPYMQYSCGFWRDAEDLDAAQQAKLALVCGKLELDARDEVLEIGGGFGGLARYMAENHGCHVRSTNISEEQMAFARTFTRGLPVDVVAEDYRDTAGRYDKVVSIAMLEAVGRKNYPAYFDVVHRCLKDDGVFLLHTIGDNRARPHVDRWIVKHIFPNGELPAPLDLARALDGRFVLEDWHVLGADYDRTLMAWHANFEREWKSLRDLGLPFDDRFRRTWRYYLLSSAGNFRCRNVQLWQLVLTRYKSGRVWRRP
jgi:cyclopropane-fatty-acyl-phospholipid synthase